MVEDMLTELLMRGKKETVKYRGTYVALPWRPPQARTSLPRRGHLSSTRRFTHIQS